MDNITSDAVALLMPNNKTILSNGFQSPEYVNEKKLLDDIPELYKNFRLVIVDLFEYKPIEYESNLEFCEAIKEKLDSLQIPHYFMNIDNVLAISALATANITVKFQDIVIFVNVHEKEIQIMELQYTENGYKTLRNESIEFDQNESHQAIREKLLGSSVYKRILLIPKLNDPLSRKLFKTILKSEKLISLDNGMDLDKARIEIGKWFFDRSYTKFYVIPKCATMYTLCYNINNNNADHLITVLPETSLPFKETVTIPKLFANDVVFVYSDCSNPIPLVRYISVTSEDHEFQITLTVDIESFPEIVIYDITKKSIKSLPETLDEKFEKKLPVIGFYDCSSVICVPGEDGYKFLDSWNGLYGKDLVIGFDKEKPTFCENALELLNTNPTFVVYDLINIMSRPADKIVPDKLWGFTVTEDTELLLEFDSYDGTKKAASPAFLMAMLLRHHLKAIKEETGEKPTEIGIRLFQDFDDEEKKRVEAGLKEACELLKIDCSFV